jgi:hypothetical protein
MNSPNTLLLEEQLQQLQLAALQQHYRTQAQAATQEGWSYEAYLAALIQQEVDRRFGNRRQRRIKDAHFPLLKELADFDFTLLPQLNRQKVLELAQGHYLAQAETVLFVGNPGWGKRTSPQAWVWPPAARIAACASSPSPTSSTSCRRRRRPINCTTIWKGAAPSPYHPG